MSTENIITLVISGSMLILSAVTFILNTHRNSKKDTVANENRLSEINQSLLKVNLKLDQVCQTTSDIKMEVKTMQNKQMEHTEQIAKMEQNISTAFVRIDELREQVKELRG